MNSKVPGCIVGQSHKIPWNRIREFQGYMSVWVEVVTRCEKCAQQVQLGTYCATCGTKCSGNKPPAMSQLRHAVQRNLTALRKLSNNQPPGLYQRLAEDIQMDCWHTSKEKDREDVYTKDQHKDYELDKPGAATMKKRLRALDDDTVEFTPFYATVIPPFLSDLELEICSGICIREEQVAEIRARRDEEATIETIADTRANAPVQFAPDGMSEILFFNGSDKSVGSLKFEDGRWVLSGNVDESAQKFLSIVNPAVPEHAAAAKLE